MSAPRREWERKVAEALQRRPERRARFTTDAGLEVQRLYPPGPERRDEAAYYLEKLGFPGEYPFTRGIYPTMYRGRLWTMRQYAGFGSAEATNERYQYLLNQGQTGLSVAFDLPTQMGYDSDHPRAEGEVGRAGVAISSLRDFEVLFDGIPLEKVSVSLTINATAPILLAMVVALAERQGAPLEELAGTVQNDILKEYIARKTYIFPPAPSLKLAVDVIEHTAKTLPRWHPISISGYHLREAGATAVQELAFTFANALEYVRAALERGLELDRFAPRLSFFFACDLNFFEEVAKFRAARRLWARLLRERFGARRRESLMLRFHVQSSGAALTAQQPLNNVIRVTLQALAAVLSGAQSLHTNSFDEALALPSAEAARIALRTQQILAEESGVADTIDPLGGSYYLEQLTDRLEEEAERLLREVERLGGARRAIEAGWVQRQIEESAYRKQRALEAGERQVVGVNVLAGEEPAPRIERVPEALVRQQRARLREVRRTRDARWVQAALERVRAAARAGENLMPPILEAGKAYATVGEICDALRAEFGEHREPATL